MEIQHTDPFEFWYALENRKKWEKVVLEFGISRSSFYRRKSLEGWEEKANRRDKVLRKKTDEKVTDSLAEMNARHIKEAIKYQGVMLEALGKLEPRSVSEAIRAYNILVKLEQVSRGEPTDILRGEVSEKTTFTDRELAIVGRDLAVLEDKVNGD